MAKTKKARSPKTENVPKPDGRKALDKRASRKTAPAPNLCVKEDGSVRLDHPDPKTAHELLQNALGTSDPHFAHGLLEVLKFVSKSDGKFEAGTFDFFLSVVRGIEPQDQLEAMMAAQMAITNHTFFEYRRLFTCDQACRNDAMTAMNKLARTFATQMAALKRYRSKGEQKVTVQHVTVSDGGQAIVGDVHPQTKVADITPASPSPPALTHSKERPMEPIGQSDGQSVAVKRRARSRPPNTEAMLGSRRCEAKTRGGTPCKSPVVHGKKRCRMHGGAEGSGAPKGNRNALKHGRFTKEAIQRRKFLNEQGRTALKFARDMGS